MNVEQRIKIERRIVSRFVKDVLRAGHTISVYDGEEWCLKRSSAYRAIMDSIMSTDIDTLRIRDGSGKSLGTATFVYGNDGYDVIADHSANEVIENLMLGANDLSEKFACI